MGTLHSLGDTTTIACALKLHQLHNCYLAYDLVEDKSRTSPRIAVNFEPRLKVHSQIALGLPCPGDAGPWLFPGPAQNTPSPQQGHG